MLEERLKTGSRRDMSAASCLFSGRHPAASGSLRFGSWDYFRGRGAPLGPGSTSQIFHLGGFFSLLLYLPSIDG